MMKLLNFLNLLDESGEGISWTNVGLVAVLIKILVAPMIDGASVVALVGMLANYAHKRVMNSKDDK